jgi:hypothetical protein
VARILAQNEEGWSTMSELSNNDVLMVAEPHTPVEALTRESNGSTLTEIKLLMPQITGTPTGGLPILSYRIESS